MDNAAHIVLGVGATTVFHPIAYAKVLIQLGHEPFPPALSTTIFGSKVPMYPNIFKYIGHIKERDGFFGLYRGLSFRLASNLIKNFVSARVFAALTEPIPENADDSDASSSKTEKGSAEVEDSALKLLKDTMNEVLSQCTGIIISQPFHVIFIRCVAQFVGKESYYSSIIPSFGEVLKTDGIAGLFAGLVPRLLGEALTICMANVLTYLINNWIISSKPQDTEIRGYSGTFSNLIVSQMTYPFIVVGNVMAISGCSELALGRVTNYTGWLACWSSLAAENELKRGSSMFWRQYKGPVTYTRNGIQEPSIQKRALL